MTLFKKSLLLLLASATSILATEQTVTLQIIPEKNQDGTPKPLEPLKVQKLLQQLSVDLEKCDWDTQNLLHNNTAITFTSSSPLCTKQHLSTLFAHTSFDIHQRHRDCATLVEKIEKGKTSIPDGFRLCSQPIKDQDGNITSSRKLLITTKPALTAKSIQHACPDRNSNSQIYIELTDEGAKKMEAFTRSLTAGKDFIVTVVNGEAINCAVLNAEVLSKNFVISGLDNLQECEQLANAITPKYPYDLQFISIKPTENPSNK